MSTLGHQYDNSLVSNAFGFLRLPMNFMPYDSDADWVITGVPFDMATSGRAGGRHGPAAIRQVSTNLAWEHNRFPWNFDMRERLNVVDCGDLVYAFGDAREMSEKLQAHAEKLLSAGKRMLSFGGDHFVTLPLLRAHAKHFGKMALVHFDAHTDTYANGCEFDHGTMFYTAPNEGLIDPNHSVQIGIRTEFDKDNGFTVLDAGQVNDRSVDDVIAQVKQIVGDMPVYLTFDIDCLDPAFAPGTGTPVIGGLTSDRAIKLVKEGKFTAEDYGQYSMMKYKGSSLAPLGTFEKKVPADVVAKVRAKEADIVAGKFTVKVDDGQPKSTAK